MHNLIWARIRTKHSHVAKDRFWTPLDGINGPEKAIYHFFMKLCLYCGELINKKDNFEKIGRKYVCLLCYDDIFQKNTKKTQMKIIMTKK